MPNQNQQDQNQKDQNHSHIREKIVKQKPTLGECAIRIIGIFLAAMVAGGAAGASFAFLRPIAESKLHPEETETTSVTIPKDQPETKVPETESVPETIEESQEEEQTASKEEVEELTKKLTEELTTELLKQYKYEFRVADIVAIASVMNSTLQTADKGIVTVRKVSQELDRFERLMEKADEKTGAVIAKTDHELLVLTSFTELKDSEILEIGFADSTIVPATIKGIDSVNQMAVLSVNLKELEDKEEDIYVIPLGNSYTNGQGDLIGTIGAPVGIVHSTAAGTINFVSRNVETVDGSTRLFYADVKGDASTGTFLVNCAGELVGWMTDAYDDTSNQNIAIATAISDYKPTLEKMSNGKKIPYLGLRVHEIQKDLLPEELEKGIYITEVIPDSPAFEAGIKPGDILIQVGDKETDTIRAYQNQLEERNVGAEIVLVVLRQGVDSYKSMEFSVTVGAR